MQILQFQENWRLTVIRSYEKLYGTKKEMGTNPAATNLIHENNTGTSRDKTMVVKI